MTLPFGPPVHPMLAKLSSEIPRGDGWIYEPKWDGFRTIAFRDGDSVDLRSRNDRPMGRYFPEVEALLAADLPADCVVDGEIILPSAKGLDFDALQMRLHPARSRVELLAKSTPCSFVLFDVLAMGSRDLRQLPLSDRLGELRGTIPASPSDPATTAGSRLFQTPRTSDPDEAARWFDDLEAVGLDGLIAKRLDLPYCPGERVMVKVKHRRTADCVVVGYRLSKAGDGIGSLLLGLYEDGTLHYVGHTSSFKAAERRALLTELEPLRTDDDHGMGRAPGGPSRWTAGKDLEWRALRPELVCEVSYDFVQGDRFRHAATFVAWRPDKDPSDCRTDQLLRR